MENKWTVVRWCFKSKHQIWFESSTLFQLLTRQIDGGRKNREKKQSFVCLGKVCLTKKNIYAQVASRTNPMRTVHKICDIQIFDELFVFLLGVDFYPNRSHEIFENWTFIDTYCILPVHCQTQSTGQSRKRNMESANKFELYREKKKCQKNPTTTTQFKAKLQLNCDKKFSDFPFHSVCSVHGYGTEATGTMNYVRNRRKQCENIAFYCRRSHVPHKMLQLH